jgi:hypothetical protein
MIIFASPREAQYFSSKKVPIVIFTRKKYNTIKK